MEQEVKAAAYDINIAGLKKKVDAAIKWEQAMAAKLKARLNRTKKR